MLPIAAQDIVHSGESIFIVSIRGEQGMPFHGTCLTVLASGETRSHSLTGVAPAEFRIVALRAHLAVQKQVKEGSIEVEIAKNGAAIKKRRTLAPFGVVALATTMPPDGPARQVELRVDGSIKRALISFTSETGDLEQQLVKVPFSKTFFPRAGWIVGLTAQKTLVTEPDPLYVDLRPRVLDDGVTGLLHVEVRINGQLLGQEESSQPFGVASATARVP